MGYRRRAGGGKRDTAEAEIMAAWEALGVQVWQLGGTGNPDVLCLIGPFFVPFEIKTGKGSLTKNQQAIPWQVIRSVEEAVDAVNHWRCFRLEQIDEPKKVRRA